MNQNNISLLDIIIEVLNYQGVIAEVQNAAQQLYEASQQLVSLFNIEARNIFIAGVAVSRPLNATVGMSILVNESVC